MRRQVLIAVFFLLPAIITFGQIKGTVYDELQRAPLPGVIITVKKAGEKKIVTYGRSDAEGRFSLKAEPKERLWLHFSLLGFRTDSVPVRAGVTDYSVTLAEQATALREVVVTSKPITESGDTVRYIVSNFSEIQDRTLADVLKKMPGIEVTDAGQIKYQGKAINKFYIEGRDMLGGRYGLATNTINPDDVGSVEVMENHQPIAALRDLSFSQDPAINIRLKENAKNRIAGTASLEGGYTDDRPAGLWDGRVTALKFGKEFQTLNTLRTTNTGSASDLWHTDFIPGFRSSLYENYRIQAPLSVPLPNPSNLPDERVVKGATHFAGTNNLWGVGEKTDLTSKAFFSRHTNRFKSNGNSVYLLPDGERVIEEVEGTTGTESVLNAELNLLVNREKFYLNDRLSGDFTWGNASIEASGSYPHKQTTENREIKIENNLSLLWRKGTNLFTLNSLIRWQKLPESLMTVKEDDGAKLSQRYSSELLFTNTSLSFGHALPFGGLLSLETGISSMNRSLRTGLEGLSSGFAPLTNDLRASFLTFYLKPELSYSRGSFDGRLTLPIAWLPYEYEGVRSTKTHTFPLAPRLTLSWQMTNRLKLGLSGGYAKEVASDDGLLDGSLLRDYKTLDRGSKVLGDRERADVGLSLNYRNALDALFANFSAGYSYSRSSLLTGRSFEGKYIVTERISRPNSGQNWNLSAQASKGFSWWRSVLTLRTSYLQGRQTILLEKKDTDYLFCLFSLTGSLNLRPSSWLSAGYEISYSVNGEAPSGESFYSRGNLYQELSLTLKPSTKWRLELTGTHFYNELTKEVRKHYFLADAAAVYSAGRWELSLRAGNIFNQKVYSYTILDALVRSSYAYETRPIEVTLGFFFTF